MIKENVKFYMEKLDFPVNEQNELLQALNELLKTNDFLNIVERYKEANFDFLSMIENVKQLAENKEICTYTAYMLLLICILPKLHEKYINQNIDEKIFYDTIYDLSYKLDECKLVHGKCGTFVPTWYKGFFEMRIFALGRLQFEINHTWFDCDIKGVHIPKGTKVLSVHIPRTGMPLNHIWVTDSYKAAKTFFKEEFDGNIVFVCNSWLLYPWNRTIYKEESNLAKFYDDFTIVSSGEYKDYSECWRLFDCLYDGNVNNLPNDTSLRKAFVARIKSGEPIGHGTGVILF